MLTLSEGPLERILSDELKSGLKITLIDEAGELYARVSWIHWDSGFRDSGLAVEDRIVGLNDVPLALPDDPNARRIARDRMIGGLQESAVFAGMGLRDGAPLTVTVRRRDLPGRGWKTLQITGSVRAERAYFTADERRAVAPGGPENLGRTDSGDPWQSWLEKRVFAWERILDGGWMTRFDSRRELADHLEWKPQIDATLAQYPGVFSTRLAEDWTRVTEVLRGRAVSLPADALTFRDASERIKREIAAAGEAAWAAALQVHNAADELPALDLVRDDRTRLAGKVIVLPGVSWSDAVKDGDRNIFATSHSGYAAYVAADQPGMRAFWRVQREYQARVEPRLPEKYDILGRLTGETGLVVTRYGAKIGLIIEALAVRVPDHFFADVTREPPSFAGAELATGRGAPPPPDGASASDVMRAYVQAVKAGDETLWLALYADWVAMGGDGEPPLYRPYDPYTNYTNDYTRARNLLLHKVSHVEPLWESDPRVVMAGTGEVPQIEQVSVLMDHIAPFEDGGRVFRSSDVNPLWQLQRRDGGPWRISSRNAL